MLCLCILIHWVVAIRHDDRRTWCVVISRLDVGGSGPIRPLSEAFCELSPGLATSSFAFAFLGDDEYEQTITWLGYLFEAQMKHCRIDRHCVVGRQKLDLLETMWPAPRKVFMLRFMAEVMLRVQWLGQNLNLSYNKISTTTFFISFLLCLATSDGVASPVHKFVEPKPAVVCVQWCPDKSSVFGSSAEDGCVNISDYEIMNSQGSLEWAKKAKTEPDPTLSGREYPLPVKSRNPIEELVQWINDDCLVNVFLTTLRGALSPLARERDEVHLKDDITDMNFSIDFSAISAYFPKWEMLHPDFSSSPCVTCI
ncbi:hypothetical protein Tco_0900765 [Tanacetum coccineum]